MTNKDFYINSHYMCGIKSDANIFDLNEEIFNCCDFMCFENAIKKYIKPIGAAMHIWPWQWHDSSLTDEVYIYEMETNRILYGTTSMKEFFDAKLVRKEQSLHGCEVFDFTFQFPLMFNIPKS